MTNHVINPYILKLKKSDSEYLILNLITKTAFFCDKEMYDVISNVTSHYCNLSDLDISELVHDNLLETLIELGIIIDKSKLIESLPKINFWENGKFESFAIILNWSCNFACNYCILRKNRAILNEHMNSHVLEKALEFIKLYSQKEINIGLTGGEPLLLENYSLIQQILEFGNIETKKLKISISTNGYTLDHYIDLFQEYENILGTVYVTLAGPPNIHNERRPHIGYKQTFDKIVKNIDQFIKSGMTRKIVIVTQFDVKNIDYIDLFIQKLSELGFLGKIQIVFQFIVNGG